MPQRDANRPPATPTRTGIPPEGEAPSSRLALTRAAITGTLSGAARAITTWLIIHLTDRT